MPAEFEQRREYFAAEATALEETLVERSNDLGEVGERLVNLRQSEAEIREELSGLNQTVAAQTEEIAQAEQHIQQAGSVEAEAQESLQITRERMEQLERQQAAFEAMLAQVNENRERVLSELQQARECSAALEQLDTRTREIGARSEEMEAIEDRIREAIGTQPTMQGIGQQPPVRQQPADGQQPPAEAPASLGPSGATTGQYRCVQTEGGYRCAFQYRNERACVSPPSWYAVPKLNALRGGILHCCRRSRSRRQMTDGLAPDTYEGAMSVDFWRLQARWSGWRDRSWPVPGDAV